MNIISSIFYGGAHILDNLNDNYISVIPKYPFNYISPYNFIYSNSKIEPFTSLSAYIDMPILDEYREACNKLEGIFNHGLWRTSLFDLSLYIDIMNVMDIQIKSKEFVFLSDPEAISTYLLSHHRNDVSKLFIVKVNVFKLYSIYKNLEFNFNASFKEKYSRPVQTFVDSYKNMITLKLKTFSSVFMAYLKYTSLLIKLFDKSNILVLNTEDENAPFYDLCDKLYLGTYDASIIDDANLKSDLERLQMLNTELFDTLDCKNIEFDLRAYIKDLIAKRKMLYCPRIDDYVSQEQCELCIETKGASLKNINRDIQLASKYPCVYEVLYKNISTSESIASFNWPYLP